MNPRAISLLPVWLAAALIAVPAAVSAHARRAQPLPAVMAGEPAPRTTNHAEIPLLLASGRTALQLGDANAAAGFFGRARELAPEDAAAHLGMASALLDLDRADLAIAEFARAQQLGSRPSAFAPDLGLAYDLAGEQSKAQAIYRSALTGRDVAQTRRRLALSLAIGDDPAAAQAVLQPLLATGDRPALLTRAFILALSGDIVRSVAALNEIRRGSGYAAEPFLRALPALSAGEKAAMFNLGIFPSRIAVSEDESLLEFASTGVTGPVVRPMEYGAGQQKPASPDTADQLRKAQLALYGVFPDR